MTIHKRYRYFILILVLGLLITVSIVFGADRGGKTTWAKGVKPGDCHVCHGENVKLPDGHPNTEDMMFPDCKQCHTKQKNQLETKILLSHIHNLSGITCSQCHEMNKFKRKITSKQCIACHGDYNTLADITKDADPNPHKSHQGKLDCNLCHHQHVKSVNYCSQCHEWPLNVP
jgi:hypothetical protein